MLVAQSGAVMDSRVHRAGSAVLATRDILGKLSFAVSPDAAARASGGIGRRAGFRCQCPKGRGGSTPPSRTERKSAPDLGYPGRGLIPFPAGGAGSGRVGLRSVRILRRFRMPRAATVGSILRIRHLLRNRRACLLEDRTERSPDGTRYAHDQATQYQSRFRLAGPKP